MANDQIRETVRATIKRAGVTRVARALGLSIEPVLRLAAGASVHDATFALAGQRIQDGALEAFAPDSPTALARRDRPKWTRGCRCVGDVAITDGEIVCAECSLPIRQAESPATDAAL